MKLESKAKLEELSYILKVNRNTIVTVGVSSCSIPKGANDVYNALKEKFKDSKFIEVRPAGCNGICHAEPMVSVYVPGYVKPRVYEQVLADDIETMSFLAPLDTRQHPYNRHQKRLVTARCGIVNPETIGDYIRLDGYKALAKAIEKSPEDIIAEVEKSGLRGRGGAGFSAARKWKSCRAAHGTEKYLIANGHNGDPGAYSDRNLMESDPHSILEGMMIAAYAIGATDGIIYAESEFPLAISRLEKAIKDAREDGILGKGILGKQGFDFNIEIHKAAGVYVCGESTALMASIEGKVGEPRVKHIHTSESGVFEKPTTLNNVETLANVPVIISMGADNYSKIGTETSKGTKVFSLAGKIR